MKSIFTNKEHSRLISCVQSRIGELIELRKTALLERDSEMFGIMQKAIVEFETILTKIKEN